MSEKDDFTSRLRACGYASGDEIVAGMCNSAAERIERLQRTDDMPWAEATERTGHDTLRHLVLDYQKLQELLEKANHGYADQIRLYNEMRADCDRYLAKLNHLEAAVEKMVPLAKVEELEREVARLKGEHLRPLRDEFYAALVTMRNYYAQAISRTAVDEVLERGWKIIQLADEQLT